VKRSLVLATTLAAALLAAGCGGDDSEGSATADWAGDVCSALADWTESLQAATSSLQGSDDPVGSLESVVEDVREATGALADDLRGLGPPETDSGEQAKESLDTLASDLEDSIETIEAAGEDVSGANDVLTAVSTITGELAKMGTQVASAFGELAELDPGGELEAAFEEAPACDELTGSAS
jgi:hypothetical protein